jgi:hypothetical protein
VFILEHYFASKSFAAVREAFSNAHPDKEVPNKTIIRRLVTKFRVTGSVRDTKHVRRRTVLTGETLQKVEETLARLQPLYCKCPLVNALLVFGQRDLRTLPRQTYFCGDFSKKDFTRIIHEGCRN